MDYFQVHVAEEDSFVECSEFWGPEVVSDQGMRVNCRASNDLYSTVKIITRIYLSISLSEIEVHTLGKFYKTLM